MKRTFRHAVCRWCYPDLSLEALARASRRLGIEAIDLVEPKDWPVLARHGLIGSMTPTHTITRGLNRKANHPACLRAIREAIEATADAGFPNVICFSGNRRGLSDEEGLANCAAALKQVVGLAEKRRVTICMELLNSRRDHADYQCDRTAWGVELCRRVGSERFKLLYDIYHMQIMEGDVIATLREHIDCIGHLHTGGVPGRAEIDDTQELNYPAILRAVSALGYRGFVAQEFVPQRKPLASLAQAIRICSV